MYSVNAKTKVEYDHVVSVLQFAQVYRFDFMDNENPHNYSRANTIFTIFGWFRMRITGIGIDESRFEFFTVTKFIENKR